MKLKKEWAILMTRPVIKYEIGSSKLYWLPKMTMEKYCRENCTRKLDWNDEKRKACRENTACTVITQMKDKYETTRKTL